MTIMEDMQLLEKRDWHFLSRYGQVVLPESSNWVKSCCCCCADVRCGKSVERNGFMCGFDGVHDAFME